MWQNHQQSYANPRFMLYASRVHTPDPSSTLRLELVIQFIWLNPVFQQPMVGWCPLVWYLLTINIQEKGRIYIMTYDFLTKTSTIFLGNLMLLAAHGHQKPHQVLSRTVLRKFPRPHTVPSGSTRVSHLQLASRSRSSRPSSEAWLMVRTRAYCRYCMILRDASSMNSKCVCRKLWVYRYTPLMVILRGTMMIKQRIFGGFSGTCICFPVTYMMKVWRANKKGGHREAENSVEAALWLWQPMESGHAQARLREVGSLFGKGGCPVTDKRQKEKPVPKNSPEASTFWWHPSINS